MSLKKIPGGRMLFVNLFIMLTMFDFLSTIIFDYLTILCFAEHIAADHVGGLDGK